MADLERHNHNLAAVVMEREALISAEATIADLITAHLIQLDGVEATTLAKNRAMADRHIIPALGKITARELTRADVVTWINSLPVAPKTAKNIHAVLSSSLNTAVRDGVIMRNVAYGVTPPKARDENNGIEPVFIPRVEVDRLIACTPERLRGLMRVLAYGGLRFGEATALRFSDISVDESGRIQLHVRRAWKNTGKKSQCTSAFPRPNNHGGSSHYLSNSPRSYAVKYNLANLAIGSSHSQTANLSHTGYFVTNTGRERSRMLRLCSRRVFMI